MAIIANTILKELKKYNPKSIKEVDSIIRELEMPLIEKIINESLNEILDWIEHQDKPDALQIYIQLKKLKEKQITNE